MSGYITPNLGMQQLSETQAGKATSVNTALVSLDMLCMLSVLRHTLAAPPAAPGSGDRYIVPTGATGVWSGKDGQTAGFYNGWIFRAPKQGWIAFSQEEGGFLKYDGAAWAPFVGGATYAELGDVAPPSGGYADKDRPYWDAASGKWLAAQLKVENLDVDATARADGLVLAWDATAGKHKYVAQPAVGGGGTGGGGTGGGSGGGGGSTGAGSVAAWANCYGPTATLRGSGNVSSVSHNGVGDFTFNFTTALVDDAFAAVFSGKFGTDANDYTIAIVSEPRHNAAPSRANNYVRVRTTYQGGGTGGGFDIDTISMVAVR